MEKPLISVIMGIYNCEATLKESLESIINQSYENWELIICDDFSTDNSLTLAKAYEKKLPGKIIVIGNNKNLTLGPTLNKCLSLAKGFYIARQDGDDISEATRFEEQVRFLENNKAFALVGSNMISFNEEGYRGVHKMKENPTLTDFYKKGVTFAHATIMMKKEVLLELGGYCEGWYAKQAEDYELWSRFFQRGYRGFNLQKNLYYVREDQKAFKRRSSKRRIRGIYLNLKILKRLKAPLWSYKTIVKDFIAIFIPSGFFKYYYTLKLKEQ